MIVFDQTAVHLILTNDKVHNVMFLGHNVGSNPVIITDIRTSCGCTVPHLSKKEIKPGESVEITLEINKIGRTGLFAVTATLLIEGNTLTLTVSGQLSTPA